MRSSQQTLLSFTSEPAAIFRHWSSGREHRAAGAATGDQTWLNTVESRGQAGVLLAHPTDYGPWGGSVSFSTLAKWNFSSQAPAIGTNDFLSVAIHEIAHILGFGTSDSWLTYSTSSHTFVGPHAERLNGGKPVLLSPDGHIGLTEPSVKSVRSCSFVRWIPTWPSAAPDAHRLGLCRPARCRLAARLMQRASGGAIAKISADVRDDGRTNLRSGDSALSCWSSGCGD